MTDTWYGQHELHLVIPERVGRHRERRRTVDPVFLRFHGACWHGARERWGQDYRVVLFDGPDATVPYVGERNDGAPVDEAGREGIAAEWRAMVAGFAREALA